MQDPDDKETKNDWEISEEDFQRFYKAIKHLAKTYVVDMTKGKFLLITIKYVFKCK